MKDGTAHTYTTSSQLTEWNLSKKAFNDSTSMLARTIATLYKTSYTNTSHYGYVLYNDQFDGESGSSTYAHAKGIIIFNSVNAIWIEHSIPKFPPKQQSGAFKIDSSQLTYGQSMICLSLPISALEQIGQQLFYAYPQVYDYFIPTSMQKVPALQNLISVVNGSHVKVSPYTSIQEIATIGKAEFVTFYKFSKFNDDLYTHLVSNNLKVDLFTETWRRGGSTNTPASCSEEFAVHNILALNFTSLGISFLGMNDHSKWAVSVPKTTSEAKYVCIGDINRQDSQQTRGGGTICFKNNQKIWELYHGIVSTVDPCPIAA